MKIDELTIEEGGKNKLNRLIHLLALSPREQAVPLAFLNSPRNDLLAYIIARKRADQVNYFGQLCIIQRWLNPNSVALLFEAAIKFAKENTTHFDPNSDKIIFEITNHIFDSPRSRIWLARKGLRFYGKNPRGNNVMAFEFSQVASSTSDQRKA